jgi:hypothetical protein
MISGTPAFHHRRPASHLLVPSGDVVKSTNVATDALEPRSNEHVNNGILAGHQFAIRMSSIKHAVQPTDLFEVTRLAVGDEFRTFD